MCLRDPNEWNNIFKISSCYCHFFYHQTCMIGYYFIHKGMDLTNYIHEYMIDQVGLVSFFNWASESPYNLWLKPQHQELFPKQLVLENVALVKNSPMVKSASYDRIYICGVDSI